MNKLLRKSDQAIPVKKETRYETLFFTQNPFPKSPGVNIGSNDPRENGSIYYPDAIRNEEHQFERLLIPKPNKPETTPIVFLMDYATRQGRGIGKTAFLNYERKRIMKDFGDELTEGAYVIFAVYVLPIPGENYNRFWKTSKLIIRALLEQNIIATAICRLRAFTGLIPERVLSEIGEDLLDTLGNDSWLHDKGVNTFDLNQQIENELATLHIDQRLARALAFHGHDESSFRNSYFNTLTDGFWRKNENRLLFHDLIKVFSHCGFIKGVVLFDELEKVFSPLNTRERRTFIEAIRYFFVDGDNENTKCSFFELLLTIHPYLQELMIPHWGAAGLERFAALGGDASENYTIYFKPIPKTVATPLAKKYLRASRIPASDVVDLFPFDEKALLEALKISGNVPGKYLSFLHRVVEKAIDEDWGKIGVGEIKSSAAVAIPTESEIEDEPQPLATPKTKLK